MRFLIGNLLLPGTGAPTRSPFSDLVAFKKIYKSFFVLFAVVGPGVMTLTRREGVEDGEEGAVFSGRRLGSWIAMETAVSG